MHAYFANIGIFFDNMAHFESWQQLRIMVAVVNADKGVNVKSRLIKLVLLPLWYGNKDIIRDTLS